MKNERLYFIVKKELEKGKSIKLIKSFLASLGLSSGRITWVLNNIK